MSPLITFLVVFLSSFSGAFAANLAPTIFQFLYNFMTPLAPLNFWGLIVFGVVLTAYFSIALFKGFVLGEWGSK